MDPAIREQDRQGGGAGERLPGHTRALLSQGELLGAHAVPGGGHIPAEAAGPRKRAAVGQESGDLTSSASSVPSSLCHLEQVVKTPLNLGSLESQAPFENKISG